MSGKPRNIDRTPARPCWLIADFDGRLLFVAHAMVRFKRTLFEQFCYLLAAGCDFTGRDMRVTHDGLGIRTADLNALVENLQQAIREAEVAFGVQNRLLAKLAKLAPMSGDVVER